MQSRARQWTATLALVGWLLIAGPSAAGALPAARVIAVQPADAAQIVDAKGARRPVRHGSLLYPGDRIVFLKPGRIEATFGQQRRTLTPESDLTIAGRPAGRAGARDVDYVEGFKRLISQPRQTIAMFPFLRDGGEQPPPRTASPLLPTGLQKVTAQTVRLAFIWRDGPALLTVGQGKAAKQVNSGQAATILVTPPPGARRFAVSMVGEPSLAWTVEVVEAAPAPPWFAPDEPASEEQRLVRALWLLREGPPEWRLFALSEIAALAEAGVFTASEIWQAAQSGQLSAYLAES